MTNTVIAARITEAREARAMSMEDLAENIGVTRQSISKFERGIIGPSPENLLTMSYILDFPIDFFYSVDSDTFAKSSPLFFRSNSSTAKKVKTACLYQVKWIDEIKRKLEKYVDFPNSDIPTIDSEYEYLSFEDIEELALQIRKKWDLGEDPITDLIGILENKGAIISQFATNHLCAFKGIEAFSSWKDGTPYILYHSFQKSAVRTRFSICHELGHLIMHSAILDDESKKKEIVDMADAQADRFAAAFLLPATSFPKEIRSTALSAFEAIKRKWGAAMSTIIKRCETLDILSESQINYLKRQMTAQKYWHKEPLDDILTLANPEMLRDAIYLLIENHLITKDSFINVLGLPLNDLKCLCGLPSDFFDECAKRSKPILRLAPSSYA